MIRYVATRRVKELTGIDFDCLSKAVTLVVEESHGKFRGGTIKVHKNAHAWDAYYSHRKLIKLNLSTKRTKRDIFASILHETRHWMQHVVFKQDIQAEIKDSITDWKAYKQSSIEVDARKFEKLAKDLLKIYKQVLRYRK